MTVTRRRAIALAASMLTLPNCASSSRLRVGSKNFTESIVIAEIYAQALEAAKFSVERRFNLGSTAIALAAMQRGGIDIYPEYTGTALIDVLHAAPVTDPRRAYEIVRSAFAHSYGIDWLDPSPMNDSQGLVTTAAIAGRYHLRTLSDLARVASKLRLATIPEFLSRPDGLPGLQRVYGGFTFASVKTYDIALKYQALLSGDADVATAFTTDGALAANHLVVLADDKHLWPPYNVAPLLRSGLRASDPRIAPILNAISPHLTNAAAQSMNAAVENDKAEPATVASAFLKSISK